MRDFRAEGFASTADAVRYKIVELGGRNPDEHHPANRAETERELKQFRDELHEFMVRHSPLLQPPPQPIFTVAQVLPESLRHAHGRRWHHQQSFRPLRLDRRQAPLPTGARKLMRRRALRRAIANRRRRCLRRRRWAVVLGGATPAAPPSVKTSLSRVRATHPPDPVLRRLEPSQSSNRTARNDRSSFKWWNVAERTGTTSTCRG
jgi:hypothetical protein